MALRRMVSLTTFLSLVGCGAASSQGTHTDAGADGNDAQGESGVDAQGGTDGSKGAEGGTGPHVEAGAGEASAPDGEAANVAPLVVNGGPSEAGGGDIDVPFVRVTICEPGTTHCQTLDYVSVDTGSAGMRVISSVLSSSLTLPSEPSTGGNTAAECIVFGDGYSWGSVRLADVKIGGETASNVPIQVIGDLPESSVPSDCSSAGSAENTVATFGYYGLLGINHKIADCGNSCENPTYYSCSASTCTATTVAVANQVSNPVASFGKDGNGVIVEFPAVPAGGAATLTGSLVFGIGTETNNGLGSASVLTIDEYGYFSTLYKGVTLPRGFLDSGSSVLYFDDSTITQCSASSMADGYYCPTSTLSLSAQNIGKNSVTSTVSFSVGNADMLLSNPAYEAFDDLGGPEGDSVTFDWGFPFFVGRNVYVAFDGATTPGGTGPYFAY